MGILTRGGMTGKFAAAAGGRQDEAYEPAQSPQSTMLSALTGGRAQSGQQVVNERSGPARVERQNYSSVPPPAALVKQDATPSYRGRGRGAGRGGPFRGQGHSLGQPNGNQGSTSHNQVESHSSIGNRGMHRGARGGRGRGHMSAGNAIRGGRGGGVAAPGPAPAPVL